MTVKQDEPATLGGRPSVALLAAVVLALLIAFGLYLGAGTRGQSPDWVLFLGRFHPLLVHVPIGVLLLVAVAETASVVPALRTRFDPVVTPLLGMLVVGGVVAFTLGTLLASDGGYPAHLLRWHRGLTLAGVVGSAAALVAWATHRATERASYRGAYRVTLAATVGGLGAGAHFGGSMTHGEDYLTRYAPAPVRWMMGAGSTLEQQPATAATATSSHREGLVYADLIQPMLTDKCAKCHGTHKTKGGLALTSLDALRGGGKSGPVVVSGSAEKSPIMKRLRLPEGHDDRMPPPGKPGPSEAEIALLGWWIDRGADPRDTIRDALPPASVRRLLEQAAVGSPPGDVPTAVPSMDEAAATQADGSGEASAADGRDETTGEPIPAAAVAIGPSGSVYADHVAPILHGYCVTCHGSAKQKGKLRVDSLAALRRGGAGGAAIVAGSAGASEIVRRMRLPAGHDDHMPPVNRPQPTDRQVALVAFWIDRGASEDLPVTALPANLAGGPGVVGATSLAEEPAPSQPTATTGEGRAVPPAVEEPPAAEWEPPPAEASGARPALPARVALYEDVVAKVLDVRCGGCHLGEPLMGGFSVEDPAALVVSGSIVPGRPEQSELWHRVALPLDDEEHMPPRKADQPTSAELALLRYWVASGAKTDVTVPTTELPPLVARVVADHVAAPARTAGSPSGPTVERPPAGAEPRRAGCASCTVGSRPSPSGLLMLAMTLVLPMAMARRRSRRLQS